MQITVSNEIIITNPSPEIESFCKKNLILENPDYYKKLRMGFYVGKTPTTISLYKKNGNKIYLPAGCISDLLQILPSGTVNEIKYDLAQNPSIDYNCEIPLYDYQEKALESMLTTNYGILQAPCGSGKTQIGISIAASLKMKTLWLTHTVDLLNQSKERAAQYMDKKLLGTITAGKVNISEGITFATVQTMVNLNLPDYKYDWDLIIVDECHRAAGTFSKLTMFSKVINSLAASRKYGLSATVHRGDGLIKSTFALLGNVAHIVTSEAVADKTIGVTIQEIKTGIRVSDACQNPDGTINYSDLIGYLAENEQRTETIVSKIVENKDHSNLILSDRLNHLRDIIAGLKAWGIHDDQIRMIDGQMVSKKAKEERKNAIIDMREGRAKFLFASYSLAKEGLDIPCLDRLYLSLPKKDFAVVTQSIGRIARTSEGKDTAIAYDFVDEIGFCINGWKQRKTIYRKKGCEIIEGTKKTVPGQKALCCF